MTSISSTAYETLTRKSGVAPSERRRDDDPAVARSESGAISAEFSRLLELSPRGVARSLQRNAADAQQMFEAAGDKVGQNGLKGSHAERSPAPIKHVSQADRRESETDSPPGVNPSSKIRADAVRPPAALQPPRSAMASALQQHTARGETAIDRREATSALSTGNLNHDGPANRTESSGHSTAIAPGRPLVEGNFAVPTADVATGHNTAARRIGEFLGGARSGSTESLPGITTPNGAGSTNRSLLKPQTGGSTSAPRGNHPGADNQVGQSRTERAEFDEVLRSLRMQLGARRSTARLRLEPPELGRLRVDVRIQGDSVSVDVQAETEAARLRLAERGAELKSGLAEHGIHVERFEVYVDSAGRGDSAEWTARQWNGSGGGFVPTPRQERSGAGSTSVDRVRQTGDETGSPDVDRSSLGAMGARNVDVRI